MSRRVLLPALAALLVIGAGASGCAGLKTPRVPFFHLGQNDEIANAPKAAKGERIPVLALNDKLQPAAALKGVDFVLPAAEPRTDWPLPGGTPEQSVAPVPAAQSFVIAWRKKVGVGGTRANHVTAEPIVADGKLFTLDGQALVTALDPATGRELWRVNFTPKSGRDREAFGGGLAYSDGVLYVTSGFRFIAALDARTGAAKWKTNTPSPVHGAPTVVNGRVYAIDVEDHLFALDAGTGQQVWDYQGLEEPARVLAASSPAVSAGVVIAPFASGELVALNEANGADLWQYVLSLSNRNNALSEIRDIAGRPVIYRGDVFAGSHSGQFAAIDLRTGQPRWTIPVTTVTTPWPAGDVVYLTDQSGQVICAARDSGQIYWLRDLNAGTKKRKLRTFWSGPLLVGGDRLIVVSQNGTAALLNAKTGATLRTLKLGSPATLSPIAVNGSAYVLTDKAELIAIR